MAAACFCLVAPSEQETIPRFRTLAGRSVADALPAGAVQGRTPSLAPSAGSGWRADLSKAPFEVLELRGGCQAFSGNVEQRSRADAMTQLPDVKQLHDDSYSVAEFALSMLSKQAAPSANESEVEEQLDAAAALAGLLERHGAAERIGHDLLGRAAERMAALAVRVSGEFDSEVAPSSDSNAESGDH